MCSPTSSISPPSRKRSAARGRQDEVYTLSFRGSGGAIGVVVATGEHPFWTQERGWVAADELQPGDQLQDVHGDTVAVLNAAEREMQVRTYNPTVEGAHDYFVSDRGVSVLVHNQDLPSSTVVIDGNMEIWHNYGNLSGSGPREHAPIHFHVRIRGVRGEFRVRGSGEPMPGSNPIPPEYFARFREHRTLLGLREHQIGRWYQRMIREGLVECP
jgi:hypothetical protein